jgi:hypothetical protein
MHGLLCVANERCRGRPVGAEQLWNVVAIHHHMQGTQPTNIFLHYWGAGAGGEAGGRIPCRNEQPRAMIKPCAPSAFSTACTSVSFIAMSPAICASACEPANAAQLLNPIRALITAPISVTYKSSRPNVYL